MQLIPQPENNQNTGIINDRPQQNMNKARARTRSQQITKIDTRTALHELPSKR